MARRCSRLRHLTCQEIPLYLKLTYVLVDLGEGFLSLPVSILVCAKDSPSSFNQCSPPGADLAWVENLPAMAFECLKGYLSLKVFFRLCFISCSFVLILGAGTDLSYLSEILGPSQ